MNKLKFLIGILLVGVIIAGCEKENPNLVEADGTTINIFPNIASNDLIGTDFTVTFDGFDFEYLNGKSVKPDFEDFPGIDYADPAFVRLEISNTVSNKGNVTHFPPLVFEAESFKPDPEVIYFLKIVVGFNYDNNDEDSYAIFTSSVMIEGEIGYLECPECISFKTVVPPIVGPGGGNTVATDFSPVFVGPTSN